MKKFAITAAAATALTLTMASGAFAQSTQATQAPMTLAAGEVTQAKEATSDTWITTKVKADLVTEKGIDFLGYKTFLTAAISKTGIEPLRDYLRGKTVLVKSWLPDGYMRRATEPICHW